MATCSHCGAVAAPGQRNCLTCGVTLTFGPQATLPGPGFHQGPHAGDAMIGRSVIGQFVVRAKLGEGGMGAVYLADQPAIGRQVVIKVIHPWLSKDPAIARQFASEARAAARLQNPHIVSIHNYGTLPDGTLFLAMEYLEGSTLEDLVRTQQRLEASRVVAIATQVCEALEEAHRKGVIHRDLKPSNIMVLSRGQGPSFVKVLDFGLAKIDGRDTQSGRTAGTPPYMSPEQLSDRPVDGRSDIYSLACILYQMLTGRPPFVARSPGAYVQLHLNEPPPAPSAVAPQAHIPPALEALVMRALAKDPNHRPQRADIFADDLWAAMMATVESSHIAAPIAHAQPPRARTVLVAIGAVVGLLAVAGGTTAWLMMSGDDDGETAPASTTTEQTPPPAPPRATDAERIAAKTHLMGREVGQLEAELLRVATLHGVLDDQVEGAMQGYRQAIASPPEGVTSNQYARSVLADLILAWRERPRDLAGSGRSQTDLEALYLMMPSTRSLEKRRRTLNALKNDAAEDPERQAELIPTLVEWIADHGRPYEDDEPIIDDERAGDRD